MRILLFASLIICASIITFAIVSNEREESKAIRFIQDGDSTFKAPDFALKSTTGKTIKLSDYKGKIVIVDFWATWCPPCRKGIPDLIDIQNKYNGNVVVIGISLDYEQTIKEVIPFVKNYGINYPVVYFDNKVVEDYGGIQSIPTSFIIDQQGNFVNRHVGLYPKYIYEEEIKELLKKSK